MLKKRMLLLVGALAAFGAIMAGAAFANPTGSAPTGASVPVTVQAPVASAALTNHDPFIPANGLPQRVDDIEASEVDGDYNIQATLLTLTPGTDGGTCVGGFSDAAVDTAPGLPQLLGGVPIKLGEYQVTMSVTNPNTCSVAGAVVTVDFEAIP